MIFFYFCLFFLGSLVYSSSGGTFSEDRKYIYFQQIHIEFGDNIGSHVESRIQQHLSIPSNKTTLYRHHQEVSFLDDYDKKCFNKEVQTNNLYIFFGKMKSNHYLSNINDSSLLEPESYSISINNCDQSTYFISVDGTPLSDEVHKNVSFDINKVHYGAVTGSYAVLEMLGFSFLHPLEPYIPLAIHLTLFPNAERKIINKPYWPDRTFHLHTQHPLELTEVLQGHDIPQFGPHGPHCQKYQKLHYQKLNPEEFSDTNSLPYCERWEDMVIDVDYFFEWSIANRLNKVEWLLLGNYKWGDELNIRMNRLKILVELSHKYSLLIGVDVPIGNVQQHAWHMVNVRLPITEQIEQIKKRIDWIFNIGFDFLTTESGLSEFTHPECDLMLDLLNTYATYVNVTWGREAGIKVHCSTGQVCQDYPDPRTGDPINFNFLPYFAHPSLGVFPHTVQAYGLDDPTANSYGNENFSYIENYMIFEAKQNKRSVVFYGETAYWVNVDIDVPLFLPIYGQRRLKDLRKIAIREKRENFRIQGQMNFDSGWEWGYWLSNLVTARASWDPILYSHEYQENQQIDEYLDEWSAFAISLQPFTSIYGQYSERLNNLLIDFTKRQIELLIFGEIDGRKSPFIQKLSGIAYLSGCDTWVDLPRRFKLSFTQPDKFHFFEYEDPNFPYVIELLVAMDIAFSDFAKEFHDLYEEIKRSSNSYQSIISFEGPSNFKAINQQALKYLEEIVDSVSLLSLRATQVRLLYESKEEKLIPYTEKSSQLHELAREMIYQASEIVQRRESNYRVNWERIASWRDNPTVYRFGYLWSAHSLYYWWRDQGLAEQLIGINRHSPCYLNRMDTTEVAVGWGKYTLQLIRYVINRFAPFPWLLNSLEIVNCLSPPVYEYEFPRDLGFTYFFNP